MASAGRRRAFADRAGGSRRRLKHRRPPSGHDGTLVHANQAEAGEQRSGEHERESCMSEANGRFRGVAAARGRHDYMYRAATREVPVQSLRCRELSITSATNPHEQCSIRDTR